IDLGVVERGLALPLYPVAMAASLAEMAERIGQAAEQTLAAGGVEAEAVTKVIFVGGTSLMQVVQAALTRGMPQAEVHRGAALTAIAQGLAMATTG
ncbi:MAG: Hsp70 family protein, partial [Pseudomonadota bacterium]